MKCKQCPKVATKKYCKDCKYYIRDIFYEGFNYRRIKGKVYVCCNKVVKRTHRDNPHEHYIDETHAIPEIDNKRNNCKHWEPHKWYQI